MKTIKEIIHYLSSGIKVITHIDGFYLGMGEDGVIRDQDNTVWDISVTNPSDYIVNEELAQ